MALTRVIHSDDEYIDGLLDSSPAIIEAIYRRFAKKVSSFILQHGGTKKDAAHIFEIALLDIYTYARRQQIELTNRFEPFFMLVCKGEWRREVQKKGMTVTEESEPEVAALDNTHLRYVHELTAEGERKRYWVRYFQLMQASCQDAISKALVGPIVDGASTDPIPTAGLLPPNFASCMSTLVRSTLGNHPAASLPASRHEQAALYVAQALPESEKQPFEAAIASDATLKHLVQQHHDAVLWLRRALGPDHTRRELGQLLADMRQSWFYTKESTPNKRMGIYVMIITVLAMIMAAMLFISPWRKDVYRQFAPVEMAHHTAANGEVAPLLHQAAELFNNRRFRQAVQVLNQALEKDPNNAYARYYRGVCLVDLNQLPAARTDLQMVYDSSATFRYDAAFYMGLSYLREGNKAQCLQWLHKIPQQAHNYWKARKLIQELE